MSDEALARAPMTPATVQDTSPLAAETDYDTICAAVMETARGRWFLAEFAKRNRHADTGTILGAIERLEASLKGERTQQTHERLRFDLMEMSKAIARTKAEIAAIKPDGESEGKLGEATGELDSIVHATERATSDILAAAEHIQEVAWTGREQNMDPALCDQLDARAVQIYTACSFQDLTGQRIHKIIQAIRYLEARITAMIEIWGASETPVPTTTSTHQNLVHDLDQSDVDLVMERAPAEAPIIEHEAEADLPAADRPVEPDAIPALAVEETPAVFAANEMTPEAAAGFAPSLDEDVAVAADPDPTATEANDPVIAEASFEPSAAIAESAPFEPTASAQADDEAAPLATSELAEPVAEPAPDFPTAAAAEPAAEVEAAPTVTAVIALPAPADPVAVPIMIGDARPVRSLHDMIEDALAAVARERGAPTFNEEIRAAVQDAFKESAEAPAEAPHPAAETLADPTAADEDLFAPLPAPVAIAAEADAPTEPSVQPSTEPPPLLAEPAPSLAAPAAPPAPTPVKSAAYDPLAAITVLSEEEKIALFS